MDYLIEGNRGGSAISAAGKNVVILGGGDTGSDCLGTVLRQGAKSVHQFEILPRPPAARDTSTPWPMWPLQLRSSHAHEEGGVRDWSLSTEEFLGKDGRVTGLRARQVSLSGGKFVPVAGAPGVELACDLVLIAAGFTGPVRAGLLEELGVSLSSRGNVVVDESFMTSVPGVFASGDTTRGASLIVWAIAEGRRMAAGMDAYVSALARPSAYGEAPV
jgi:glutamate synthase (NADPH/NADH) small chain